MPFTKTPTNKELAAAYVACGQATGFFNAEMILMKYLPANKPDGKCHDVPRKNRAKFLADLKTNTPK